MRRAGPRAALTRLSAHRLGLSGTERVTIEVMSMSTNAMYPRGDAPPARALRADDGARMLMGLKQPTRVRVEPPSTVKSSTVSTAQGAASPST